MFGIVYKITNKLDGKRFSDPKERQKMSNANNHRKTKILCINSGIVYDSFKSAANELNLKTYDICHVLSGKRKHVKGYTFKRV